MLSGVSKLSKFSDWLTNLLSSFSLALNLNQQKLADMERNMDVFSVVKVNDYSDPRKAGLLVSTSTADAASLHTCNTLAFLLQNCSVHLPSPGGHNCVNNCGISGINYLLFQIPRLKLTDTTPTDMGNKHMFSAASKTYHWEKKCC